MTTIKVFNKQWKRIFTIAYVDNYGFAVDTLGVQHDIRALRNVLEDDTPRFIPYI